MRKGLLAFAFAVSLGLLGCGGGGGTIIVPPGLADNVILYYVFDSGGALYTIKSDGTDKALVSNGEFASLVVNPARTAIAFTRKVGNFNHIFTMNVNGTGLTQVTTDDHNHDNPSFDQTGSILYFDRDMDGTGINDRKIVRWGLISGVMTQLTFC
ncbi:MAG: hypothetical protein R2688_08060 [Fimbriimonadaceae bacterium]